MVSLVLFVALGAARGLTRPADSVGARLAPPAPADEPHEPVAARRSSPRGTAEPLPVPRPQRRVAAPPPEPLLETSSARVADLPPVTTPQPVLLRFPRLGVEAPVVAVGAIAATGELEIPPDVRTLGWYRPGVAPGAAAGNAVLAGHVDSETQGPGALFSLDTAARGDEIVVVLADGQELRYQVEGRQRYLKEALPVAEIFTTTGEQRLVLITCGGGFDPVLRQYAENIVVHAVPLAGP